MNIEFNKLTINPGVHCPIFYFNPSLYDFSSEEFNKSNTQDILFQAHPKRLIEFFCGRACAREGLKYLNFAQEAPLASNNDRTVHWPEGTIGSIAHSQNRVAALVVSTQDYQSVGLDVERTDRIKNFSSFQDYVCSPCEINFFKQTTLPPLQLLTLIFSAKESIYKCLYPIYKQYLGFKDVEIESFDEANTTFKLRPQVKKIGALSTPNLFGYYHFEDGYVFTMFALKQDPKEKC